MTSLTTYLAEVSAREKAATLGPWENRDYRVHQGPKPIIDAGAEGDLDFIAAARTDVPTLLAMVQAVVELHVSKVTFDGREYCGQCLESDGVKWPCSTIRALTTAKEAGR